MIVEIAVENLAIIESTQLALGPGFTVLTGETGAGKSLLVDAIELALGERADADLVRSGAPRALVSVVIDLSDRPELRAKCQELGIPLEENLLYIQREVFAEGRSQCRVSGKLMPVSGLKQLGQVLVDLHGQHDHQSLLHPEKHLGFFDDWIGEPALSLLSEVAKGYSRTEALRRKLAAIRSGMREREQRLDLLTYQTNEIESVDPQPGEFAHLETQLSRLKNAARLSEAAAGSLASLSGEENCAEDRLGQVVRTLEESAKLDRSLEPVLDPLRSALFSLQDGVRELRRYADEIEADPAALEETAARMDSLKRLFRKYGDDEEAVRQFAERAREELAILSDVEQSEADAVAQLEQSEHELMALAAKLSELRRERSGDFAALVEAQLRELAMEKAAFEVSMRDKEIDSTGADQIEFFFSANAGEPPRPLAKIASGGEISRLMLAIKTAMAGRGQVPTLIFDEVDAGLGGRAAAVVASKLEQLAEHYQVLVISHLPQIASRASSHYRIEKVEERGRVRTQVVPLSGDERVEEIGRMLSGHQVSEVTKEAAREMLDQVSSVKS